VRRLGAPALAAAVLGLLAPAASAAGDLRLELPAGPLELGQPFELRLRAEQELPHSGDGPMELLAQERRARLELRRQVEALELAEELLEPGWALLAASPTTIRREAEAPGLPDHLDGPAEAGRLVASRSWTLAALEAPASPLPIPADWPLAEGSRDLQLEVTGLLGPDEDSARPPSGFLPLPDLEVEQPAAGLDGPVLVAAGALTLGLLAGLVGLLRRRGSSGQAGERRPEPAERLAALRPLAEPGAGASPEELREAHFELTALVRCALEPDLSGGLAGPGATDAEWAAALPERLAPAGALLEGCAEVKYGGRPASAWALAERLAQAEQLLALAAGSGAQQEGRA
jgi:hypothetical protein